MASLLKYYIHADKDGFVKNYIEAAVDFTVENSEEGDILVRLKSPLCETVVGNRVLLLNALRNML